MTEYTLFPPEGCEFRQCNQCSMPYVHKTSMHSDKSICLWCEVDGDKLYQKCKEDWDKHDIDVRFDCE